jgi:multicomponent Na+:H+ antiporter subunit C
MTTVEIYSFAGCLLFITGIGGVLFCDNRLRKILAANLAGSGLFLVLIALARRSVDLPPDPVPHALVLTGILVAVSATALASALHRSLVVTDNQAVSDQKDDS